MQEKYALRNIAIALVLSYEGRCKKVADLSALIDDQAELIRSTSAFDGTPHGSGPGDPTAQVALRIERLSEHRQQEQNRIDAVDWALTCACEEQLPDNAPYLEEALLSYYSDRNHANAVIDSKTDISPQTFAAIRQRFLQRILNYLDLQNELTI